MVFELFSVVGVSYKKSNAEIRSKFGLTVE